MSVWNKAKIPLEISGIALLIVLAAWVLSKTGGQAHNPLLFVPADVVAKNTESWDRMTTTSTAVAPFTPLDNIWESVQLTSQTNEVRLKLEMPRPETTLPYYPATRYEGKFGETVKVGSGALRLDVIGTAWRTSKIKETPYYWFGPDFKTPRSIKNRRDVNQVHAYFDDVNYGDYPQVYLYFESDDWKKIDCSRIEVFDARTHRTLTGAGYSSSSSGESKRFWAKVSLTAWHTTPVDVVVTLGTDDNTKTVEFSPNIGDGFRDGNVDFRLASVLEHLGVHGSSVSSSDGKMTMQVDCGPQPKTTTWSFIAQPQGFPFLKIDFLDADSKVLKTVNGLATNSAFINVGVELDREKVAKIRVTYSLEQRHAVFHLAEIPGLPEANRGVKDLSAVRIPYARFDSEDSVRNYVAKFLGCSHSSVSGGTGYFVSSSGIAAKKEILEFKDVTAGEMAQTMADKLDADVRIDGNALVFEKHKTLREQMQEWWMKTRVWLKI